MPILQIKALPQKDQTKVTPALKKTAKAISEAYNCSPEQVWVTWTELSSGHYVEGTTDSDQQPDSTHPPICELLCFEGKSSEEIEDILSKAAKTLSKELGIPNNIFMTYREAKSGQVIAGNGIVRKK